MVVNPYRRYPIYTNTVVKMYIGKRRNEVPPHLFAISDGAYVQMMNGINSKIVCFSATYSQIYYSLFKNRCQGPVHANYVSKLVLYVKIKCAAHK